MTYITCNIQLAYSNRFKSNVCDQLYCNRKYSVYRYFIFGVEFPPPIFNTPICEAYLQGVSLVFSGFYFLLLRRASRKFQRINRHCIQLIAHKLQCMQFYLVC